MKNERAPVLDGSTRTEIAARVGCIRQPVVARPEPPLEEEGAHLASGWAAALLGRPANIAVAGAIVQVAEQRVVERRVADRKRLPTPRWRPPGAGMRRLFELEEFEPDDPSTVELPNDLALLSAFPQRAERLEPRLDAESHENL